VSYIRGMFAFAVWQGRERTLLLYRDPMGIKPLYYWCPPTGGVVFASEIKGLLEFSGIARSLDQRALRQFLEFGYTFESDRTIIRDVNKLPPGHLLRVCGGEKPKLQRYYRPQLKSADIVDARSAEEELYFALEEVTKQHLVADVPVGLLLS